MLKRYSQSCSGRGALSHTMSPHGLIPPPIKRSRILVRSGVVIAAKRVAATFVAARYLAVKFRFPISSETKPPRSRAKSGPAPQSTPTVSCRSSTLEKPHKIWNGLWHLNNNYRINCFISYVPNISYFLIYQTLPIGSKPPQGLNIRL
jgi:hypothetical protein